MSPMKIACYSTRPYDKQQFDQANKEFCFDIEYFDTALSENTCALASGCDAVCIFVNDTANEGVLRCLAAHGVKIIALRCAGYNNVDLAVAKELGLSVARVPAYSPHAVAEYTVALLSCINRKIHKSHLRTKEMNFNLEGLLGVDLYEKTVGVIGTGIIGRLFAKIMLQGFGCKVIAYDPYPHQELLDLNIEYMTLNELFGRSDIISLHCPLTEETKHMINEQSINMMKSQVIIINTGRGALIDTQAAIEGIKNKKIGGLAIDVYEEESKLFYTDRSDQIIKDDLFVRLINFPNVLVTGHQGFFTEEALKAIAQTTLNNIALISTKQECKNTL